MSSTDNIITLKSSDEQSFKVEKAVARRSRTISRWIDDGIPDDGILIPKVTGKILSKVIEYCKKHVCDIDRDYSVAGDDLEAWGAEVDRAALLDLIRNFSKLNVHYKRDGVDGDDLEAWDAEFVKVDWDTLLDLIMAANDLGVKGLRDLTCRAAADMIKATIPKNPNITFNIRDELTPEEEEEERRENQWAF